MRFLITVLIFCVPLSSFAQGVEAPRILQGIIRDSGYTCDNPSQIYVMDKDMIQSLYNEPSPPENIWIVSCKNNGKGNRDYKYNVYYYKVPRDRPKLRVCHKSDCRESRF